MKNEDVEAKNRVSAFLFHESQCLLDNIRVYIYIYITHTHLNAKMISSKHRGTNTSYVALKAA